MWAEAAEMADKFPQRGILPQWQFPVLLPLSVTFPGVSELATARLAITGE